MSYKDIDEAHEDVVRHGGSTNIIWNKVRPDETDFVPTRIVESLDICTGFHAECVDGASVSFEGAEQRTIGSLSSPMKAQRCIEANDRATRGIPQK